MFARPRHLSRNNGNASTIVQGGSSDTDGSGGEHYTFTHDEYDYLTTIIYNGAAASEPVMDGTGEIMLSNMGDVLLNTRHP